MTFNLSEASSVLKVRYLGSVREQLNNATVLLNKIEKREQMVSGKDFTMPLHTGRNKSAGKGTTDGGNLPAFGNQQFTTTVVPNKYQYARIKVTGPTIAATRDNMGAFVEALESEADGATRDMKRAFNRQLHSDGTDAIAFWQGADNSTPALIDDGQGNAFVHFVGTDTFDLIDGTDNSTKNGDSISFTISKNGANYEAAWSSGTVANSGDGDYLVYEDTLGNQMMGIRGIVSDSNPPLGALQNLTNAGGANDFWKANVFSNSGTNRQLAFEDMQEVIDAIATVGDYSENDIDLILCGFPVRRAYYKLCIAERRQINTMELDGGFSALDFNGIPLVADSQCRRNVMYFLVTDSLTLLRTSDFDWMDRQGSYLWPIDGQDAYQGVLFHYGNLACGTRNANGLLADITEA